MMMPDEHHAASQCLPPSSNTNAQLLYCRPDNHVRVGDFSEPLLVSFHQFKLFSALYRGFLEPAIQPVFLYPPNEFLDVITVNSDAMIIRNINGAAVLILEA
jgi:hypothetical protein